MNNTIYNCGLTCKLLSFYGDGYTANGHLKKENWKCDFGEKVQCEDTGVWGQVMFEEAKHLLPLGDKQTQDELWKEWVMFEGYVLIEQENQEESEEVEEI